MRKNYDFSGAKKLSNCDDMSWTKTVTEMTQRPRFLEFSNNLYAVNGIIRVIKKDDRGIDEPVFKIYLWLHGCDIPMIESYPTSLYRDQRFIEIAGILG